MALAAPAFRIQAASPDDVPLILRFIRELAAYERLSHEVVATEDLLRATLFGARPAAEVVVARAGDEPAGFAMYFQTYSTFLARPGMYLEDLFVLPEWRGRGLGRQLLAHLARVAVERGYGRMEWSVLDWNEQALGVYRAVGARPMDEWTVQRLTGDALRALAQTAAPRIASS
ncbi:MAG: GNAT family N-acetyltransferase [Acidobacteria bacterium]|nr:GNAT family N-acetyltransferase [Acidobacteriota bacterium]